MEARMAQDNRQKIKLLKLVELLQQETDENHPLTTTAIINCLMKMGISCERRTVSKDMALLNEEGIEVLWQWVGKEKGYYISDRSFSIPELKILIDAVQAASFITDKKTQALIDKIAFLGGSHQAELLKRNIVCFNTRKHSNESIYYNVDFLEEAIQKGKKISFCYFDLDEHGKKVYRRKGKEYILDPIALIFNEDNYYLVALNSKYERPANYRVDRMDQVSLLDEAESEKAIAYRHTLDGYTSQVFKMYGGELKNVTLHFSKELINAVYDKFGEETKMRCLGENRYATTVKVQLSPTFWGWLLQFGRNMKVVAPSSVIKAYKTQVESLLAEE